MSVRAVVEGYGGRKWGKNGGGGDRFFTKLKFSHRQGK